MYQFITIQQIFFKDKSIEDTCRLEAIKFHTLLLNNPIEEWEQFMNERVIDEGFYFICKNKLFKFTYLNNNSFDIIKTLSNNYLHNSNNLDIHNDKIFDFINNINLIDNKELVDNYNNMFIQFYNNIFFIVADKKIINDNHIFFNNFYDFINSNHKYILI